LLFLSNYSYKKNVPIAALIQSIKNELAWRRIEAKNFC